jgi:UPF0042 nucleotide-binding protein
MHESEICLQDGRQQGNNDITRVVIVTGYSGAGKNTVLRALEDIGFFCIDNLPIALLNSLFTIVVQAKTPGQRIALVIDARNGSAHMDQVLNDLYATIQPQQIALHILFVSSSKNTLLKRFQETRRSHPLAQNGDLLDAIEQEQQLLQPFLDRADIILDTNEWNTHQVREFVRNAFMQLTIPQLLVSLTSFGFKYGVPQESSMVYDVRFLKNPYFIPELKLLTGLDIAVSEYLFSHQDTQEFWQKFSDFLLYTIEQSYKEGRFFLNIAVGCTGGKHRSVAFVHEFAKIKIPYVSYVVKHRDITKE